MNRVASEFLFSSSLCHCRCNNKWLCSRLDARRTPATLYSTQSHAAVAVQYFHSNRLLWFQFDFSFLLLRVSEWVSVWRSFTFCTMRVKTYLSHKVDPTRTNGPRGKLIKMQCDACVGDALSFQLLQLVCGNKTCMHSFVIFYCWLWRWLVRSLMKKWVRYGTAHVARNLVRRSDNVWPYINGASTISDSFVIYG